MRASETTQTVLSKLSAIAIGGILLTFSLSLTNFHSFSQSEGKLPEDTGYRATQQATVGPGEEIVLQLLPSPPAYTPQMLKRQLQAAQKSRRPGPPLEIEPVIQLSKMPPTEERKLAKSCLLQQRQHFFLRQSLFGFSGILLRPDCYL